MGCILALTLLVGLAVPIFASAGEVEIVFLNPLAELEPINNMPIASRAPLRAKIAAGEDIRLLVMHYGKINNHEMGIALADLLRDEFVKMNPDLAGKITIQVATGGTSLYSVLPASTATNNLIATDNANAAYWKNQGPTVNGAAESRVPFFGNPWGPKTGYAYTGYPSYEMNFERYAQWASHDAVILTAAD